MKIIFISVAILLFPILSIAGLDKDLNDNLSKSRCVQSWKYDRSAFKLYLNPYACKENESSAAILTVRYMFESNNHTFPERIKIYNSAGEDMGSYPFENIPSLVK